MLGKGIDRAVRAEEVKALLPIKVTEEGRVMEVREEQEENADCSMEVTEEGRVIEVREEQPENAI